MGLIRTAASHGRRLEGRLLQAIPVRVNARPDFLMIGAQKAGTTSLYAWLTSHPDVLRARNKELHFFDREPADVRIGAYWPNFPLELRLRALQRWRARTVVTGEATPIYLFDPRVPAMVAEHLPDLKLIVLLRDPVQRAISHYWMMVNQGDESLSLEDALAAEPERLAPEWRPVLNGQPPGVLFRKASYVARGLYADQLQRWFDHFAREQFLILEFKDLADDPVSVYRRTLTFLGVDPDAARPPDFAPVGVGSKRATAPEVIEFLRRQFVEPNERLQALVGIDFNSQAR